MRSICETREDQHIMRGLKVVGCPIVQEILRLKSRDDILRKGEEEGGSCSSPSNNIDLWVMAVMGFNLNTNPRILKSLPSSLPPFNTGQVSLYLTPCGAHEAEQGPLDMSHKTHDLHLADQVGIRTVRSCGMILSDVKQKTQTRKEF